MTFKEFCETHRINVTRCWHESTETTNGINHYRYGLELQCGPIGTKNVYLTSYGVGEGIVERWARETDARSATPIDIGCGARITRSSALRGSWRTLAGRAWLEAIAPKYMPEPADVLQCLALDAQSAQNSGSFDAWASDLGYDTDSRKAEGIYRACCDEAIKLQRWLGLERYAQLLDCTEE